MELLTICFILMLSMKIVFLMDPKDQASLSTEVQFKENDKKLTQTNEIESSSLHIDKSDLQQNRESHQINENPIKRESGKTLRNGENEIENDFHICEIQHRLENINEIMHAVHEISGRVKDTIMDTDNFQCKIHNTNLGFHNMLKDTITEQDEKNEHVYLCKLNNAIRAAYIMHCKLQNKLFAVSLILNDANTVMRATKKRAIMEAKIKEMKKRRKLKSIQECEEEDAQNESSEESDSSSSSGSTTSDTSSEDSSTDSETGYRKKQIADVKGNLYLVENSSDEQQNELEEEYREFEKVVSPVRSQYTPNDPDACILTAILWRALGAFDGVFILANELFRILSNLQDRVCVLHNKTYGLHAMRGPEMPMNKDDSEYLKFHTVACNMITMESNIFKLLNVSYELIKGVFIEIHKRHNPECDPLLHINLLKLFHRCNRNETSHEHSQHAPHGHDDTEKQYSVNSNDQEDGPNDYESKGTNNNVSVQTEESEESEESEEVEETKEIEKSEEAKEGKEVEKHKIESAQSSQEESKKEKYKRMKLPRQRKKKRHEVSQVTKRINYRYRRDGDDDVLFTSKPSTEPDDTECTQEQTAESLEQTAESLEQTEPERNYENLYLSPQIIDGMLICSVRDINDTLMDKKNRYDSFLYRFVDLGFEKITAISVGFLILLTLTLHIMLSKDPTNYPQLQ